MKPVLTAGNVDSMVLARQGSVFNRDAPTGPCLDAEETFQPMPNIHCFEAVTYTDTLGWEGSTQRSRLSCECNLQKSHHLAS